MIKNLIYGLIHTAIIGILVISWLQVFFKNY